MRNTIFTPTTELTIIASIIGVSTCPEAVADAPITTRTKSGRNEIIANMATPTAIEMTVDARSIGILNNEKGRSGSAARVSAIANATKSTAAAPKHPVFRITIKK